MTSNNDIQQDVDSASPLDAISEIRQELRPGMGKAVYIVDGNPERTIRNEIRYEAVRWKTGLDDLLNRIHPYRFKVIRDAEIKQINVIHAFEKLTSYEVEELYKVAEMTGSHLVTKDLRKTDTIIGGEVVYTRASQTITVAMIMPQSEAGVSHRDRDQGEYLKAGSIEAVFSTDGQDKHLSWTEERPMALQYDIRTTANLSKEELLDIAVNMVFIE